MREGSQDYLPAAIQDVFLATVTEFVWLPWKEAMQHVLQNASQGGSQVRPSCPSNQRIRKTATLHVAEYMKVKIFLHITMHAPQSHIRALQRKIMA